MSDFWDWWDTIWSEATRAHANKGAPAHEAAEGKRRAITRLQAVITRHTANAIQNLATPRGLSLSRASVQRRSRPPSDLRRRP